MRSIFTAIVFWLLAQAAFGAHSAAALISNEITDTGRYALCVEKENTVSKDVLSGRAATESSG